MANLRVDKITSTETFETTGSVQFDGSGDYLSLAVSSDFQFGSGDFTIECWAYAFDEGTDDILGIYNTGANRRTFALRKDQTESMQFLFSSNGTGGISIDSADGIISLNTWHHYAVVRKDLEYTIYLDGKNVGSRFSSDAIYTNTDDGLRIGSSYNTDFDGHISNVRILKGKALYTENFTPPTRELTVTPETVLLACQHKTDASHEKTGKTITVTGNAVANELTPGLLTDVVKSGGNSAITGSVEFDGSGSTSGGYLELAKAPFQFLHKGTDSYTVEAWVHKQASTQGTIFDTGGTSSTTIGTVLFGDSGGVLKFRTRQALQASPDATITTGDVMANDMWHHVALTYDKSTFRLFVNGILVGSTSYSTESSTDSTQSLKIGAYEYSTDTKEGYFNGFISNLRIVKGTALYTDNFIPPTRELKKVPGTVLLCCQDSNDPTTEATGKTITGYGDLSRTDIGVNLVSNGDFTTNTDGWSVLNTGTFTASGGQATLSDSDGTGTSPVAYQSISTFIPGAMYIFQFDTTAAREAYGYVSTTAGANTLGMSSTYATPAYTGLLTGTRKILFRATQSTMIINFSDGSGSDFDITVDNVKVYKLDPGNRASDFTPQVGNDGSVEFVGPTKINTENYFYLPTGDTESRAIKQSHAPTGTRGIFGGGFVGPGSGDIRDTIQYITISSTGDAIDFGTLTQSRYGNAALSDSTRAVWAGGVNPTPSYFNVIDYVSIMSGGSAADFGDLYSNAYYPAGASNATRGIYAGGYQFPSPAGFRNEIGYITIASKGDSQDFGDLTTARNSHSSFSSPTRGVFAGGATPGKINSIEYVTISSTGNSKDFGDLTVARNYGGGCGNSTRGLIGGGSNPSADNTIDYVTIQSTGNATDFGDLTSARQEIGSCSSATRGVFAGAWSPSKVNTIDYVSIQTTGNAQTFGELVNIGVMQEMGTSNGHGGLG